MICPVCQAQNLKSYLITEGTSSTLMGYPSYYDEKGKYHHHDDNAKTTYCKCSNGHEFSYRYENSCSCGWKGKEEKYTVHVPKDWPNEEEPQLTYSVKFYKDDEHRN
jgi:hypothetical protein